MLSFVMFLGVIVLVSLFVRTTCQIFNSTQFDPDDYWIPVRSGQATKNPWDQVIDSEITTPPKTNKPFSPPIHNESDDREIAL